MQRFGNYNGEPFSLGFLIHSLTSIQRACKIASMTLKEFATMGGEARAKKLSKRRRVEIARNAGLASAKAKQRASKNNAKLPNFILQNRSPKC